MIMKNIIGRLILFCLMLAGTVHAGSNLNIVNQLGAEKLVTASSLRTITFSGSNLNLNYQDGNSESVVLTDIRKLYFSSLPTVLKAEQKIGLILYPNPVSQTLSLRNIPEGATVATIWHISGRKVMQATLTSENPTLDVSGLASGLYLLKIQNLTLRFSKK
jgi:hypothetical protein